MTYIGVRGKKLRVFNPYRTKTLHFGPRIEKWSS